MTRSWWRRAIPRGAAAAAAGLAVCALLAGCGGAGARPGAAAREAGPAPRSAAVPRTAAAPRGSAAPAHPAAAAPTVHIRVERLHSASPPYTATLHVPALAWAGHEKTAAKVDAAIGTVVDGQVAAFTKGVELDLANAHGLPASLPESSLTLTSEVERVDGRVASFGFREEPYFRGAANAAQEPFGLSFDLATGRRYALPDLFRTGATYLPTLARLAKAGLASFHPAGARCYLGGGPAADAADFAEWWLSPAGLVLAFPAGQYTAAYCGPPHVQIPAAELRSVARPGGPLAGGG